MKLAIMQPYFFPYIGYFQLINAVDKFVFYDDVNYINRGWINRNKILINNKPSYFTVQLRGASQNKQINQIEIIDNHPKLLKTIEMAYKRAPFFEQVYPIIEDCLLFKTNVIGSLAMNSVKRVCEYLDIPTDFEASSSHYSGTKDLERAERIISICKSSKADTYINAIGGIEIYCKEDFLKYGIELLFIKPENIVYSQYNNLFQPWLSIIDVLMFNGVTEVKNMLNKYSIV